MVRTITASLCCVLFYAHVTIYQEISDLGDEVWLQGL